MSANVIRIAAVADVHYSRDGQTRLRPLFEEAARRADILLLAGDLTDYGHPEEAQFLAKDLSDLDGLAVVAVLGNHDCESGHESEVSAVLRAAGVRVLDGEAVEVRGVGIAGAKGFGGGFGRGTLEPWGEPGVKAFVRESIDEALKLERALARLTTPVRIALLHYAPIRDTVVGEPEEIYAFLGSGRLEEPINRYGATVTFHGHAHRGAAEGKTSTGIPVYNVALPILQKRQPAMPLKILEFPVSGAAPARPKPPAARKPDAPSSSAGNGQKPSPRSMSAEL